ncbi:hypothetical protein F2Q69_00040044 [Brassica cretica]|uniref:Uncharacterized protein n=1 Tax=Brassica cretica TaxID=69181 RepID=A0A8S9NJS9_BRACR|nr:hypothetical protein F2Q69_00040044 [Brassica cretica]
METSTTLAVEKDDGNERRAEVEKQETLGRWRCQLDASWVLEDTGAALDPELDAIQTLRTYFTSFSLSFISNSLNFRADAFAKEARSRDLHYTFVDILVPVLLAHEASTIGPV